MISSGSQRAKREVVEVAQAMLSGSLDLVTGCRKLCELRHQIGASESDVFLPIIGFESETDDYPLGPARASFGKDYLEKLDQETQAYVERARPGVLAACTRIIESLGGG
jgi:hypothetical protein